MSSLNQLEDDHCGSPNHYSSRNEDLKICDPSIYFHFSVAAMVLISGIVITTFSVLNYATKQLLVVETSRDVVEPLQFFLVLSGPILINIGAIVTVKTVVYMRRKVLIRNSARRNALIRILAHGSHRNDSHRGSTVTLPPTYESVVQSSDPPNYSTCLLSESNLSVGEFENEHVPPSYESALELSGTTELNRLVNEEKIDLRV